MSNTENRKRVFFHCADETGEGLLPDELGEVFPLPLDLAKISERAGAVAEAAIDAGSGAECWIGWVVDVTDEDGKTVLKVDFPNAVGSFPG